MALAVEAGVNMPISALQTHKISATNALRRAIMQLQRAHIESASLDARLLLEHVLGVTREALLLDNIKMTASQEVAYDALIERRATRQPVAQLIGKREFYGREFKVTCDTLDPRPDSETLIDAVLDMVMGHGSWVLGKNNTLTILDLGTGTGCLLLTLLSELKHASGTGVDRCAKALNVARENAIKFGLQARAGFVEGCWGEGLNKQFDLVISNPPYIPTAEIATLAKEVAEYEPKGALDGGKDGLDCYRDIAAQLPALLKDGGRAVFEIGMNQERDVRDICNANGLKFVEQKNDLAGIVRSVIVEKS